MKEPIDIGEKYCDVDESLQSREGSGTDKPPVKSFQNATRDVADEKHHSNLSKFLKEKGHSC